MKYQYTTADYIAAIEREQAKRATTYPKIIAKMIKNGEDVTIKTLEMQYAKELLIGVHYIIEDSLDSMFIDVIKMEMLNELIREYKMRRKCYPRFVIFKRMTYETAEYEKWIWRELCIYFAETYQGDAQIALDIIETKTRKRKSHADPR